MLLLENERVQRGAHHGAHAADTALFALLKGQGTQALQLVLIDIKGVALLDSAPIPSSRGDGAYGRYEGNGGCPWYGGDGCGLIGRRRRPYWIGCVGRSGKHLLLEQGITQQLIGRCGPRLWGTWWWWLDTRQAIKGRA